jgi:hypothetical protein
MSGSSGWIGSQIVFISILNVIKEIFHNRHKKFAKRTDRLIHISVQPFSIPLQPSKPALSARGCLSMKLMKAFLLCSIVSSAYAVEDRIGFVTHFEQGWNPDSVIPMIADSGAGWIRDDWSWAKGELSPGVYQVPADQQHWLDVAQANGLKVVVVLDPNHLYSDPYDPAGASKFCAWLAKTEGSKIAAIEVGKETNDLYASLENPGWKTKYVTLLNRIYAAVKASNPMTSVIGTGSQGGSELSLLAMGIQADGVTYSPYPAGNADPPETVNQPPYTEYVSWVQAVRVATTLPLWETSWGIPTYDAISEYNQAMFDVRRVLESLGLGIAHTFISDAKDENNDATNPTDMYGALRASLDPKQSYFAMQRLALALTDAQATGSGVQVNPGGSAANFDYANFRGYVFQDAVHHRTVAAVWIGNAPTNVVNDVSYLAQITFTVPFHQNSIILDPITGESVRVSSYKYSETAGQFTIYNLPVTSSPKIIIMR